MAASRLLKSNCRYRCKGCFQIPASQTSWINSFEPQPLYTPHIGQDSPRSREFRSIQIRDDKFLSLHPLHQNNTGLLDRYINSIQASDTTQFLGTTFIPFYHKDYSTKVLLIDSNRLYFKHDILVVFHKVSAQMLWRVFTEYIQTRYKSWDLRINYSHTGTLFLSPSDIILQTQWNKGEWNLFLGPRSWDDNKLEAKHRASISRIFHTNLSR